MKAKLDYLYQRISMTVAGTLKGAQWTSILSPVPPPPPFSKARARRANCWKIKHLLTLALQWTVDGAKATHPWGKNHKSESLSDDSCLSKPTEFCDKAQIFISSLQWKGSVPLTPPLVVKARNTACLEGGTEELRVRTATTDSHSGAVGVTRDLN